MNDEPHLVVVDDDPEDFECLVMAAERADLALHLVHAEDGLALADLLDRLPPLTPKVLLVDLSMPREDGYLLMARLRGQARWSLLPMVALTTASDPSTVQRAYEAGASAFISKPTTLSAMQDMLRAIRTFWFDVALLPESAHRRTPGERTSP